MKQGIHPKYNNQVQVTCTCGHSFITGSIVDSIKVEICSNCHPFYTGEVKLLDLAGRVDKFTSKASKSQALKSKKQTKAPIVVPQEEPQSLKEMLQSAKKSLSQKQS